VSYGEVLVDKSAIDIILRLLDDIVTTSFGYIFYCAFFTCTVVVLNCFVMCIYIYIYIYIYMCVCVYVCVCVGFVVCVFGNMYTNTLRLP
jgi:hypothetical protein